MAKETRREPGESKESIPNATTTDNVSSDIKDKDPIMEEPIIEREHTQQPQPGTGSAPMPEYKPPPPPEGEETTDQAEGPAEQEEVPHYEEMNKSMKDMTPESRHESATFMGEMALGIYGEGKRILGNKLLLFDMKKLRKMHDKGEIDLDVPIPYGPGEWVKFGEAIKAYNKRSENVFGLRKWFHDRALPILVAEFEERGIGLSRLQYLGLLVATDLKNEIAIGMKVYGEHTDLIDAGREAAKYWKQAGSPPAPKKEEMVTPPPPPPPEPPPPEPPAPIPDTTPKDHIPPPPPPSITRPRRTAGQHSNNKRRQSPKRRAT